MAGWLYPSAVYKKFFNVFSSSLICNREKDSNCMSDLTITPFILTGNLCPLTLKEWAVTNGKATREQIENGPIDVWATQECLNDFIKYLENEGVIKCLNEHLVTELTNQPKKGRLNE